MMLMRVMTKTLVALSFLSLISCGDDSQDYADSSLSSGSASGPCPSNINWTYPQSTAVTKSVYNFSKSKLGQIVGDGECATLASTAVRNAGAVAHKNLGPTGNNADYVWGKFIARATMSNKFVRGVAVGDIVQYRDFTSKWYPTPNSWKTSSAPHHTSVVSAVSADGKSLCVLQQNSPRGGAVSYGYVSISGMQSGSLSVYRPYK